MHFEELRKWIVCDEKRAQTRKCSSLPDTISNASEDQPFARKSERGREIAPPLPRMQGKVREKEGE